MIAFSEREGAIEFTVKIHAGARRNEVVKEHDGLLKVAVSAARERGRANSAVIATLAELIGVRKADIAIVRGATSSRKTIRVTGMPLPRLKSAIEMGVRRIADP